RRICHLSFVICPLQMTMTNDKSLWKNRSFSRSSGIGYGVDGCHHAPRDAETATGALRLLIALTRSVMTTMMALLAAHRCIWCMSNVPTSLPRRAYEHEAASVHPAVHELHHIVEQHHV